MHINTVYCTYNTLFIVLTIYTHPSIHPSIDCAYFVVHLTVHVRIVDRHRVPSEHTKRDPALIFRDQRALLKGALVYFWKEIGTYKTNTPMNCISSSLSILRRECKRICSTLLCCHCDFYIKDDNLCVCVCGLRYCVSHLKNPLWWWDLPLSLHKYSVFKIISSLKEATLHRLFTSTTIARPV